MTKIAEETDDRSLLDERVNAVAGRAHTDAAPMLEYVHQWQDIRRIWTSPTDPQERASARVAADREYMRVGRENIRRQSMAHLAKRLAYGAFILWAGEIPVRYSDINSVPRILIRTIWGLQALLFVTALVGAFALIRYGRAAEGCTLAAVLVYVTAVHFPILKEARQSLPAQPTVLVLAAVGFAYLSRHLLPLKPQVHERQHL